MSNMETFDGDCCNKRIMNELLLLVSETVSLFAVTLNARI